MRPFKVVSATKMKVGLNMLTLQLKNVGILAIGNIGAQRKEKNVAMQVTILHRLWILEF